MIISVQLASPVNFENFRFLKFFLEPSEENIIWSNIIEYCKKNNTTFNDDSFPHTNESIGDLKSLKGLKEIVWLRPEKICTEDGVETKWTIMNNNPQATDVKQGSLENCWLLSALAIIAECPQVLKHIVLTEKYEECGIYKIK